MTERSYSARIVQHLHQQFCLPEEQVKQMLPTFKKALAEHMDALDKARRGGEFAQLGKAAHTIKGAFLNLGLSQCAEMALAVERAALTNNCSLDYDFLLNQMRKVVSGIVSEEES